MLSCAITGLGFNIRGGLDNIHIKNDPGIFVTTVRMNGAAAKDGRLQKGDKILEVSWSDWNLHLEDILIFVLGLVTQFIPSIYSCTSWGPKCSGCFERPMFV